uniref:SAM domain-containing protein n=1 Tax=Electrophorus electricus TaxID=8005 RepID=A0A4W4GJE9_ELEEL
MISDASEMLAAALEQMDGIIAGSKAMDYSNGLFDCQSPTSPFLGSLRALHLLEDLRGALDLMDVEERESLRGQVPATTAECLVEWLQSRLTNGHGSGAGDGVYQEQLSRLESEKECLVLQVSVLTDQVEVQGEKIKDLEMCLEEHRMKLIATEELLQQELLSRSSLETQKLELLTEVSSLKLKLATVDRENRESEGLYQELSDMHLRIAAMEAEKAQQERSLNLTRVRVLLEEYPSFSSHRMRKSQSTSFNLEDAPESEFRRGGVRATAGPRLGCLYLRTCTPPPFFFFWSNQVCVWLQEQGLGLYVSQVQQWISSGSMHLNASPHDLEKELGIRHPLHRKKLQLALQTLGSEEDDTMGKLDFNWVTRWLDDIGLPQYKSQFEEGRVDGRMLHYMTVDNLLALKVGSVLHHFSIKRAIQVLRINRYDPSCLRRRPSDESNITPAEVCQWTNHRVMEWLRSVDLAEYAPNLRGSGVHGGLMVLEPRFNVETMALLLNIPPSKTLLRRHLATHFHLLIGAEEQGLKQECLENPDYMPLTATARVKPRRLSFGGFGTLRRKRQEEIEEYVCPMDVQMPQGSSFHTRQHIYRNDLDQLKQVPVLQSSQTCPYISTSMTMGPTGVSSFVVFRVQCTNAVFL